MMNLSRVPAAGGAAVPAMGIFLLTAIWCIVQGGGGKYNDHTNEEILTLISSPNNKWL